MAAPSKKEIIQKIEQMSDGAQLIFTLNETFGGGVAIIELNPSYPEKGQKKYLLRWGKSIEDTKAQAPLINSDKAKNVAGWVADRFGQWA